MRTLTLTLALFCAGFSTANAQQFLLQAVSGATLVGDTFFVQPGQNFTVRTILDMQGTTANIALVHTALAYRIDGASNNKLSFVSGVNDTGFRSLFPTIFPVTPFLDRAAALSSPSNYSTGAGQLPRVIFNIYGAPPATSVPVSGSYSINDITFTNTLAAGEIYGDTSNETGLFLAFQNGPGMSPGIAASGYTGRRFGSPKYKVQAVPEPATLTVALAGLALMRARRKRPAKV